MTTQTASLFAIACVALWLASALLRMMRRGVFAGWPLTFLPGSACFRYVAELSRGGTALSLVPSASNQSQLLISLASLGLSVLSAVQWGWRWLFWTVWICNGLVCAVIVYLVFFWKVFS